VEDGAFVFFCGLYGRKGAMEVLRTVRRYWKKLSLYFSIVCIFGQLHLFFFGD
jgi:hypothetical protein